MSTVCVMRFKVCPQGVDRTVSRGRAVSKVDNKLEASNRDRQVNADRRRGDNRAARNKVGNRLEVSRTADSRMAHRGDRVRLANEVTVVATGKMGKVAI